MTYNTTKILADSLRHQEKSVVLLNDTAAQSFGELEEKFSHHTFVSYEGWKS